MTNCKQCNSERLIQIQGHCRDCYGEWNLKTGTEYTGYVPIWMGGGDDIMIVVCKDCGQIQGDWPRKDEEEDDYKAVQHD